VGLTVLGRFSDTNLTATATLTGGTWSVALPLENLKNDDRYVGAPARCEDPRDLTKSQFEVVFPEPRLVDHIAFLFHSMTIGALFRLTITATDDPTYADPIYASGWDFVFPSIYDPMDLEWGVDNWWTGSLPESERSLYPPHRQIPIDQVLAKRIRVELDDRTTGASYIDLGGLWIASGWSPQINFARGRQLKVNPRDLTDEGASGRVFGEARQPRRQLSVTYANLVDTESWRLVDAAMRARTTGKVLFVPNADDVPSMMREAFPATFNTPPGAQFVRQFMNQTAMVLDEVLA
jgi:hypothetical protein